MRKYERLTPDKLSIAVASCTNFSEVCRILNKKPVGGNITNIQLLCTKWNISTVHMTGEPHNKGQVSPRRKHPDQVLVKGQPTDRRTDAAKLRRALLARGVPYVCACCGINEWNDQPLTLEIDHKDSQYWNNEQSNLQFICPNCHSQETSNRGRLVKSVDT